MSQATVWPCLGFPQFLMCKVKQMGNKQVVNKVSAGVDRRVAPSLGAAGSISDGGVGVY